MATNVRIYLKLKRKYIVLNEMEFNLYLLLLVTQWTATQVTTENERTLQSIALILICAITLNSINYNNHSQLTLWMVDSQLTYWFTSSHPFLG